MDENADASQAIFEPSPENWRRPLGRPRTTWTKNIHDDLSSLDLGIHEARDLAQSLETDVFVQRYALVVVHHTTGLAMICTAILTRRQLLYCHAIDISVISLLKKALE